ncbi:MAG: hypothetical protein ABIV50_03915 [Opitutus sp.]
MNRRVLLLAPLIPWFGPALRSQSTPVPEAPIPVSQAPARNTNQQALITPPAGENQRVYGSRGALISAETAQSVTEKFRAAFGQPSSPRIVIHVNRALIDTAAGLKLTGRTEKYYESTSSQKGGEPTTSSDKSGENTYSSADTPRALSLADQQTVREIERLFGRVFRNAGARLADQRAATVLLTDQPGVRLGGDQGAKERDALKQVADIAVEVLISSRNLTVAGISGDNTYTIPDIQTTAIRLSDSTILGQAAASDVVGQGPAAGSAARQYSSQDITEATAFALLEDMLTGAK